MVAFCTLAGTPLSLMRSLLGADITGCAIPAFERPRAPDASPALPLEAPYAMYGMSPKPRPAASQKATAGRMKGIS